MVLIPFEIYFFIKPFSNVKWLHSVKCTWMVFLYQTFVKRRCAFCVQLYSSAGHRKRLSRTLSVFLSRAFWSEQYFYCDLMNISIVIWTIFLLWSEQYFYCDLKNIFIVILWIFLSWPEQYVYRDSKNMFIVILRIFSIVILRIFLLWS